MEGERYPWTIWITLSLVRIVPDGLPAYPLSMARVNYCKKCLIEHDEAIHEATVSLHEWLRERLQRSLEEPVFEELTPAA